MAHCRLTAVEVGLLGSGGKGGRFTFFRDTDPVVLELWGLESPEKVQEVGRDEPERWLLLLLALEPCPSSSL